MTGSIIGLDLSLRSTGAVVVPLDWDIKWRRVETMIAGYPIKKATMAQKAARIRGVVGAVVDFVTLHAPKAVWMEELAFSQSGSRSQEISGLTWAVRVALYERGHEINVVTSSAARKRLLGKVPRRDQKVAVQLALNDIGAPFADQDDLCDAFAVANYGLSEIGGRSLMLAAEGESDE